MKTIKVEDINYLYPILGIENDFFTPTRDYNNLISKEKNKFIENNKNIDILKTNITKLRESFSTGFKQVTNFIKNNEINKKINEITNNINELEKNNNQCNIEISKYEQILRNRKIFIDLIIENTNNENKLDQLTDQSTVLYMACELLKICIEKTAEAEAKAEAKVYLHDILRPLNTDPRILYDTKYVKNYHVGDNYQGYIFKPEYKAIFKLLHDIFLDNRKCYVINNKIVMEKSGGGKMNKFQKFCNKYLNH